MKKYILVVLLAAATVVCAQAQNSKKAQVYIIDGQVVENFDGSQLEGKLIASYKIEKERHIIQTEEFKEVSFQKDVPVENVSVIGSGELSPSIRIRSTGGPEPRIICDDKVITFQEMAQLGPNNIESITVIKDQRDPLYKKYCEEGFKDGLIIIKLKK